MSLARANSEKQDRNQRTLEEKQRIGDAKAEANANKVEARNDAETYCDFTQVFEMIRNKLGEFKGGLSATHSASIMTVVITKDKEYSIVFDCAKIRCFNESIPEMVTSYIVAQILKIAEAEPAQTQAVINEATLNLQYKVLVLRAMGAHLYTPTNPMT